MAEGGRDRRGPGWGVSFAAALAVLGFIVAVQWNSSAAREEFTSSARQVLAAQVQDLETEQRALREQITEHQAQVEAFQQRGGESETTLRVLNDRLAEARVTAGLTAVRGPGVVVEIADSKRVIPEGGDVDDFIVQVDDLRDIVTGLWASGAEAISINDERLVATTSIYAVGSSILVNTAFLSPPFRVWAIGSGDLEGRLLAHPGFVGRVKLRIDSFGLEFGTLSVPELEIGPYDGSTRFRWGVPVEGGR
jgi:uncharacterized protein YlxW (UPF0749 family)